jgi:hypothetical protein
MRLERWAGHRLDLHLSVCWESGPSTPPKAGKLLGPTFNIRDYPFFPLFPCSIAFLCDLYASNAGRVNDPTYIYLFVGKAVRAPRRRRVNCSDLHLLSVIIRSFRSSRVLSLFFAVNAPRTLGGSSTRPTFIFCWESGPSTPPKAGKLLGPTLLIRENPSDPSNPPTFVGAGVFYCFSLRCTRLERWAGQRPALHFLCGFV